MLRKIGNFFFDGWGFFFVFLLAGLLPFGIQAAIMFIDGTAGHEASLAVFGPNSQFVCEWATDSQALMLTESGRHRLVNTETRMEPGHTYRLTKPICVPKAGYVGKIRLYKVS
jgi:hypothetical protein